MAYKTFSIDDFSGGLNTAVAVSRLDPRFSPDLENVDFTDTGAITRRRGYAAITGTPMSGRVDALYRYYQRDTDKYWLTVAGTAAYVRQDAGVAAPVTRVEAETAFVSGVDWVTTAYPLGLWSAGAAKVGDDLCGTATFSVPKSTQLTIGLYLSGIDPLFRPKIRVRIGATTYPTITATSGVVFKRTYTGLSATAHTVQVCGSYASGNSSIGVDYFDYMSTSSVTKVNSTLSATTDQFGFATLNDVCYFNSPYDRMLKFNGTSVVNATSVTATPPRGGYLIEHKRRLWTAGDYADPACLYYSDVDEPEDWIGGGSIYLAGKDSGGRCTGLTAFDNKVFYFSDSRIYAIDPTGPDTNWNAAMSGYNSISWSLGCIAPKSLVQTDNALIFLSADGVRAYGYIPGMYSQDGSGLIDISENIRPTLDGISDALKAKCAGAFYNGRYWLACALEDGATDNDSVLVYSLPQGNKPGAWTLYSNMPVASFFVTRGDEYGLYAGGTNGHIYRMEYGESDNGSAITMRYVTPQLAPGGFEAIKHFNTLHIAAESDTSQSLTVGVNTDDLEYSDQTASVTPNTAAQPVRMSISSRGRSIQYELTSDGAAQPLSVSRLTTSYLAQKAR